MGCCHQNETAGLTDMSALAICPQCGFDPFIRNHFFTGKMMGTAEFMSETHYHAEKMRHHNVRLHGWGVVRGLKVKQHPTPDCHAHYVVVESGSALDCCGHEILVPAEEIVDIGGLPQIKQLARDTLSHTLQLCVRWRECPTEDVPVLYDECGCDNTQCAPNRILESYAFDVLVDPVLSLSELVGRPALGAFVDSNTSGVTGHVSAANGKVALIDPGNAKRLFLLDPSHRSMKTVLLAADARALTLAVDGQHVFVVTKSTTTSDQCEVHVFKMDDLTEVASSGNPRKIPNTTANSKLRAVSGNAAAARLAVLDVDSGNLHRWKSHLTEVIPGAPTSLTLVNGSGMTALTSNGDALAYAISGSKIVKINLAAASAAASQSDLFTFTTATPVALAVYSLGVQPMLAVAGLANSTVPTLYALDPAAPNANTAVSLAFDPVYVAAAGEWLHVFEDNNGHSVVQAVHIPSLGTATPVITAPRLTGGGAQEIVLLFDGGQAGAILASQLADSDCAEHLWHQLEGCPACDRPDCVVLAMIANYRPGMEMLEPDKQPSDATKTPVRIDNRTGRRMLASTATLQAWLECLQLKGGVPGPSGPTGRDGTNGVDGQNGKDGIGLNLGLPKIIDIAWVHGGEVPLTSLKRDTLGMDGAGDASGRITQWGDPRNRPNPEKPLPLFTLYFNKKVTTQPTWWRQVFSLRVEAPMALPWGRYTNPYVSPGFYWPLDFKLYGEIVEVSGPMWTPHTGEKAAYAVTFLLPNEFFEHTDQQGSTVISLGYLYVFLAGYLASFAKIEEPSINIRFNGAFVGVTDATTGRILQDGVLDGDHIGGRVGIDEKRLRPPDFALADGKNPSGNMTQGGVFESWVRINVLGRDQQDPDSKHAITTYLKTNPMVTKFNEMPMPSSPNLANLDHMVSLGIKRNLASRIIEERETRGSFLGAADLKKRLVGLTASDFEKIASHMLIV